MSGEGEMVTTVTELWTKDKDTEKLDGREKSEGEVGETDGELILRKDTPQGPHILLLFPIKLLHLNVCASWVSLC